MAVNRAETTKIIIDYREAFFRMIDEIDSSGQERSASEEFTVAAYERYLAHYTRNLADGDRKTVLDALSVANLKRNNMLVFSHDQTGRFLLAGWLREMLRSFDDVRLRGLTQPDLDHLHERLSGLLSQVKAPNVLWIDNDLGFKELVHTVHSVFNDVAHRLTQNVSALKGRCDALAQIADSKDYSSMDRAGQIARALEEIFSIYERNVIPTLRFLDPKLAIKRVMTVEADRSVINDAPMHIVEQVIERFSQSNKHDYVAQLKRVEFQILSLSSEVTILRQGLEQYIQLVEVQRKRYETIERRYNQLVEEVRARQDGRRRGYRIPIESNLFAKARRLSGIKENKTRPGGLIDWPMGYGPKYLREFLRVQRYKKDTEQAIQRVPRAKRHISHSALKMERKRRDLFRIMNSYKAPTPCPDIILTLHGYLKDALFEYELPDIVEAITGLNVPMHASATRRNTIEHDGWSYTYYVRSIEDESTPGKKRA